MEQAIDIACDMHELKQLLAIMEQGSAMGNPDVIPLPQLESIPECNSTLDMEGFSSPDDGLNMDQLFNFSLKEACRIIKERKHDDRNVSGAAELVLILAYSVLITAGLVTNLAVSFVVARRSQLHTPRNLYIVNLTISDITLCLVCMPFTLVRLIMRRWTLGQFFCKLVPALQGANIMVSTGTIAAIALDRYFTIVKRSPHEGGGGAAMKARRRRIVLSIAAVWFLSALATLPLIFTQRVESLAIQHVVLYETCIEHWKSRRTKLAYTIGTLIVMYVIPIAVVAAVHARIAAFLRAHATQLTSTGSGAAGRACREMARNRRTTILLSGVAVLFAVSWLPHYVLSVLVDADPNLIEAEQLYVVTAACHVIAMSSAVSNPIVYGWLNTNIRREFIALLPPVLVRACCQKQNTRGTARCGVSGAGRNGVDREALGLSAAGAGLLGETTAMFDDKHNAREPSPYTPAKEHDTTILLVPRGATSMPRLTVSTQLVSEL